VKLSGIEEKIHEQAAAPHPWGEADLVQLDPDHPGFRDRGYRERRNAIARLAIAGVTAPVEYTSEEHATWREVWRNLAPLHEQLACSQYLEASSIVALDREFVPQFGDINAALMASTGFALRPVAGLVGDRTFLGYLGRDLFLATQYMRHPSRPLYTPEPDVVHELIGHAPTFAEPGFARLNRAFGRAAARVDADRLAEVARLYWYTLEFGVCREKGALKAYGAGLLSSFGELGDCERRPELRPFDIAEMVATPYDPTNYQRVLYVAPSFSEMANRCCDWLDSL
jgi:phenylalanine-4-hydroxylase